MSKRTTAYSLLICAASLIISLIAVFLINRFKPNDPTAFEAALVTGMLFFALCLSCIISVCVIFSIMRSHGYEMPSFQVLTAVIMLIVSFVVGASGQFGFLRVTKETIVDTEKKRNDVNVSLMLDTSGSMINCIDSEKSAANSLVELFTENDRAQIIPFSSNIDYENKTELLFMTQSNKTAMHTKIDSLYALGGTAIEVGFDEAVKDLLNLPKGKMTNNIIVITDAVVSFGDYYTLEKTVTENGIKVYVVIINGGDAGDLDKLTKNSGGYCVDLGSDTSPETLKSAFSDIFEDIVNEHKRTEREVYVEYLAFQDDLTWLQLVIRILTFAVEAAIISKAAFGKQIKVGGIIIGGILGIAAGVVVTLCNDADLSIISEAAIALLIGTVFVGFGSRSDENGGML